MVAAAAWSAAGDAAVAEKPMSGAAVRADIAAVVHEAAAVSGTNTGTAVLVAGAGRDGRPLRRECVVTHDTGPVEPRGTASRVAAALRRHGWRRLAPAPRQLPGSTTYARHGWTLSLSRSAWPFPESGVREYWTFIATADRCRPA